MTGESYFLRVHSYPTTSVYDYSTTTTEVTTHLNYLALPLSVAYTQHTNGLGFQAFAGPYIGLLLGGTYNHLYTNHSVSPPLSILREGHVQVGDTYSTTSYDEYSRSLDAGVQAGVGYRMSLLLVQATYSLGLKNVAANYAQPISPTSYNRALQLSAAYLVGFKK